MSWENRIENIEFKIITGDGRVFTPLWKTAEKEKEFNTSSFQFINVYGTLVDRKKPQSSKYPLVFYFQGADNIDQADAFEVSADDPRPWKITHPFYGTISGQPLSIKRNDSSLNITEITVPFWESIEADYPAINFGTKDNTRDKQQAIYIYAAESYTNNLIVAPIDIDKQKQSLAEMASETKELQDNTTYGQFENFLNKGFKAIDNLLEDPLNAIEQIQNFLELPSRYERAIEGRIGSYENIYYRLKDTIRTLADKKYFEVIGSSVIASMSVTASSPEEGDYVLITDVEKMSNKLASVYSDYLNTINEISVSIYDVNNAYTPDPLVQSELSSLVQYTIAGLYELAFQTKRERIIYTDKKTNVFLLVHRYLGLDEDGENIKNFIQTNDIKLNELFSIEKGREIRYTK